MSDILYFEVLDLPLPQLQQLKTLTVWWHNSKAEEVASHALRLPKQSVVQDVLNDLRDKVSAVAHGVSKDSTWDLWRATC